MVLPAELQRLIQDEPAVASIIDGYSALNRIYYQSLSAMSVAVPSLPLVQNSSQVALEAQNSSSTATFQPNR